MAHSGSNPSRRSFLVAMAAPVIVSACGRRLPPGFDAPPLPAMSAVGLFPAASYTIDLADVIGRGLRELAIDVAGKRVLLKPNMVEYEPGTAINTHPLVVAGAAAAMRKAGASDVVVAEGPGHRRDIEYLLSSTGLGDHLREGRVRFTDLNHDDVRMVKLPANFTGLGQIALPVEVLDADVIVSMPKLKTHHWAGMTCSMKNLFGVLPGAVYGWPKNVLHVRGIHNSILDLVATVKPKLSIVDGITAMEGDGPIMGKPRTLGFIAMGADAVAVDATCARVIGLVPERIDYLARADGVLGHLDGARIEQRGEAISRYATSFEVIPDLAGLKATSGS